MAKHCPICGKNMIALNLKRKLISRRKHRSNDIITYKECEPLWYGVWICPYCHYSSHYLGFSL